MKSLPISINSNEKERMNTSEHDHLMTGNKFPSYSGKNSSSQHVYIDGTQLEHDASFQKIDERNDDSFIERIAQKLPYIRGRPITYKLKENLNAGITVSLINLPLSISLSLAANGTPSQVSTDKC